MLPVDGFETAWENKIWCGYQVLLTIIVTPKRMIYALVRW